MTQAARIDESETDLNDSDADAEDFVSRGKLTENIPFERYIALPGEHSSSLKQMLVSPLHYRYAADHSRPDTESLRIGRATHTAVLEPDRFPLEYAVYAGATTGEGSRNAKKAWKEANQDKTLLDRDDYARACRIRDAVRANKRAVELLTGGAAEVTAQWTHMPSGLPCKARYDYLGPAGFVDIKTTAKIDAYSFAAQAARLAYHVQFGLYSGAHSAIVGRRIPCWAIVVESAQPHDVVVYRVPDSLIDDGTMVAADLLGRVKECRASGLWPGVAGDEDQELQLPEWMGASRKSTSLELEMPDGSIAAY